MSDAAAFLHAIQADPDDDTARLVFADWLEERGEPRGEFIRVQIALANPNLPESGRQPLKLRERMLLAAHEKQWAEAFQPLALGWTFQRGFVEKVTVKATDFLQHAEQLFSLAPIRHVALVRIQRKLPDLLRSGHLDRLASLELDKNDLGDTDAVLLAEGARLPRLNVLDVSENFIGIGGARALAAAAHLSSLTTLVLAHNPIRDMGLQALTSAPRRSGLTTLRLPFCDLEASGMRYLAETSHLRHLHVLDLSHNEIGDSGVRTLARSKGLTSLRQLRLRGCNLGAQAAGALLKSPFPGQLVHLDLRGNAIARLQQESLHQRFGADVCVF